MLYENFDLSLTPTDQGGAYRLAVLHSPAGEAQETADFPFDAVALKYHLTKLENALLKSSGLGRAVSPEEQVVQEFGQALFDFLMPGEIGRRYDVSQTLCRQAGKGLRLKLRIEDPRLSGLPWEFLYDRRFNTYLALSHYTPLVRYLELPQALRPLEVAAPLRILGMVANPVNLPSLKVAVEKERVEQALADLRAAGLVELTWLEGEGWRDLQRAMRRTWHIFHFIGHGGFDRQRKEGYLAFSNQQGEADHIGAGSLTRLLDHDALRLVLLNACDGGQSGADVFSSTAAALVRSGRPCVVAMQYAITDAAAVEFAHTFYDALAYGLPLEGAVSDARNSITFSRQGSLEWGTPVIFTHAPDGVLFNLTAPPTGRPVAQPDDASPAAPLGQDSVSPDTWRRVSTSSTDPQRPASTPPPTAPPRPARLPWRLNARGLPLIETWEQLQEVTTLPARILWVKDQKEMALIPAGPFLMGTTEAEARQMAKEAGWEPKWTLAETPQRQVVLSDFYMDVTPVTHDEYARFLADNPSHRIPRIAEEWGKPYNWDEKNRRPPTELLDHPVVLVSWEDAAAYTRWAGKALPTEEQWEKGTRGTDGRRYPWGNEWENSRLNCAERLAGRAIKNASEWRAWWDKEQKALWQQVNTTPVGSYYSGASPYGLTDVAGNVWEWCDAWYAAYPGSMAQHENFGQKYRVVRGGAWRSNRNHVRCAHRIWVDPHGRSDYVGFRCASTAF